MISSLLGENSSYHLAKLSSWSPETGRFSSSSSTEHLALITGGDFLVEPRLTAAEGRPWTEEAMTAAFFSRLGLKMSRSLRH